MFARRQSGAGLSPAEAVALVLTAVWILGVAAFLLVVGVSGSGMLGDPLGVLTVVLVVVLPVAMIWIAAMAARHASSVREDVSRVQDSLDAIRQSYLAQQQAAVTAVKPSVEKKLEQIAAQQRKTEDAIALFTSIREDAAPSPTADPPKANSAVAKTEPENHAGRQASLDLATRESKPLVPVSINDFIVALNFPETPDDAAGFRALRRAMQDRRSAELIQASQDILTLLSKEGIYMDDMAPDLARPELWRRFAKGERGRTIAAIGGIRDRTGIALTAGRMRQDHIFRDAAHHFLRKFDHTFAEFERVASDAEIVALAETRTARAFMLLGRVAGTFD